MSQTLHDGLHLLRLKLQDLHRIAIDTASDPRDRREILNRMFADLDRDLRQLDAESSRYEPLDR
jgi:hypothetical protein